MDSRHREVLKKYSPLLQQSINLHDMQLKRSLRESKIFTVHMLKDIYDGEASFFEELPTRGPDAFFRFINLLKENHLTSVAEKLCHVASSAYQISDNHGCCYIILNYEFKGIENSEELKELKSGCNLEATNLDSALQKDFDYRKYRRNLEADEMYSELKEFSKMDSLKQVNSCIVIILGYGIKYGDSKVIYGRNGQSGSRLQIGEDNILFGPPCFRELKYKKMKLLPIGFVERAQYSH